MKRIGKVFKFKVKLKLWISIPAVGKQSSGAYTKTPTQAYF